jgi:hypothetical protein
MTVNRALDAAGRTEAHIGLPLVGLNTTRLGVPDGVTSAVQVELAGGLLVAGHCDDE